MNDVHYIENETQMSVLVSSSYGWPPLGTIMIVTYPSGHRYAARQEDFEKHFTIVSPQTIEVRGSDLHHVRPTDKQLELQGDGSCQEV